MADVNKMLTILRKLAQEAEAVKPLVKKGAMSAGEFGSEANLVDGQKIVQKLTSGSEYADKIDRLKALKNKTGGVAAVGGAVAATTMSPDEASAAGVETIARTLGVGLEEAAKIKALAKSNVPMDVFEENIKAIQTVSNYKKSPKDFTKIGHGMDFRAMLTPDGKILKEPKDLTPDVDMNRIAPALVEEAGLGPKTKNVTAGDKTYMIQDKVTPLDDIIQKSRRGQDAELEKLYKQSDELWKNVNIRDNAAMDAIRNSPEHKAIDDAIRERQNVILKNEGLDVNEMLKEYQAIPDDRKGWSGTTEEKIKADPEGSFESLMRMKAQQKLGKVVQPRDLHSGNIGLNADGKPTAFDTSRFDDFKPQNLTPEQRSAIETSNIALPDKKRILQEILDGKRTASAAAVAPVMGVNYNANQGMKDAASSIGDLYSSIRKPINDVTSGVGSFIADTVRPNIPLSPEAKQQERDFAGGVTSIALDPANYIAPGAGLAVGAADLAAPDKPKQDPMELLKSYLGKQ